MGGDDVWKLDGELFACVGSLKDGVSVKTPGIESAQTLIDAGIDAKARYFHRSWVHLPWNADSGELQHRLNASYDIVRASLTKKVQATLPPRS